MNMSEVFEQCELDVNGYFEAALEQDGDKLTAARHAAKCHDDLVEALTGLLADIDLGAYSVTLNSEKYAKAALAKAKG